METETASSLQVVAGLGNPGTEYQGTRHNVGFMAVESLVPGRAFELRGKSRVTKAELGGHEVLLAMPQAYMNRSGDALREILEESGATHAQLLVLYDDVEIPFGQVRVRERGSDGGHNGMKSIVAALETTEIARIRIGVGRSEGVDLVDHVLADFSTAEKAQLPQILGAVGEAALLVLAGQAGKAMSLFNRRDLLATGGSGGTTPPPPETPCS